MVAGALPRLQMRAGENESENAHLHRARSRHLVLILGHAGAGAWAGALLLATQPAVAGTLPPLRMQVGENENESAQYLLRRLRCLVAK